MAVTARTTEEKEMSVVRVLSRIVDWVIVAVCVWLYVDKGTLEEAAQSSDFGWRWPARHLFPRPDLIDWLQICLAVGWAVVAEVLKLRERRMWVCWVVHLIQLSVVGFHAVSIVWLLM